MNVLDEKIPEPQVRLLLRRRIPVRQIGKEIGRKGMKDDQIIPLLHRLDRPTFFTFDGDFYDRRLCYPEYCLVDLDVEEELAADCIRRLLRHRALNSKAKRMGYVIRIGSSGLAFWHIRGKQESRLAWD